MAVEQPMEPGALARDSVHVRVEPDLAKERPIGVRDRLRAHRDDAHSAPPARELPQPGFELPWARAHADRHRHPVKTQTGKFGGELGRDEPGRGREFDLLAHQCPSSARTFVVNAAGACHWLPTSRYRTRPPRYASSSS